MVKLVERVPNTEGLIIVAAGSVLTQLFLD